MSSTYYEAHGSVCGSCPHRHRSLSTAYRCMRRHQKDVRRGNPGTGSYSDRAVRKVVDGSPAALAESEREKLMDIEYRERWG